MALRDNSIGGFNFIALIGQVIPPRQRVMADDRPGVTGTEFTLLSRKGTPFELISQVDSENYADARETYMLYRSLIEQGAVELIQAGVSTYVEDNYGVKVLDVTPTRLLPIKGAVGNLKSSTPHEGYCECKWLLQAVPLA